MKAIKILLLTFSLAVSTNFGVKSEKILDLNALSAEIELLLRDSNRLIPEGETITLFFSISEDKSIQHLTVASADSKTCALLEKKFGNQKLDGEKWREGMIYELSIAGRKAACIANR